MLKALVTSNSTTQSLFYYLHDFSNRVHCRPSLSKAIISGAEAAGCFQVVLNAVLYYFSKSFPIVFSWHNSLYKDGLLSGFSPFRSNTIHAIFHWFENEASLRHELNISLIISVLPENIDLITVFGTPSGPWALPVSVLTLVSRTPMLVIYGKLRTTGVNGHVILAT